MRFIRVIGFLSALFISSSAIPVPKKTFYLKTQAVEGDKFDGLYVVPIHTFAGTNAATFVNEKKRAVPSFLVDSALYFAFSKGPDQQYPMQLQLTDPSAAWGTTTINIVDKPDKSFVIKGDHLILKGKYPPESAYKAYDKGAHWRVCEWTHGIPELFWNYPSTSDNIHPKFNPSTCSLVNLKVIPA